MSRPQSGYEAREWRLDTFDGRIHAASGDGERIFTVDAIAEHNALVVAFNALSCRVEEAEATAERRSSDLESCEERAKEWEEAAVNCSACAVCLIKRAEALAALLKKYGHHQQTCDLAIPSCSCGWDQGRAALYGGKPE